MYEKFTCFYPIFSVPPSIFHFNSALILSNREGIGNVIVIIPNLRYDFLNQDQCVELFEFYGKAHPLIDIKVEKSPFENPFEDIRNRFKKDPNLAGFIALDEKTAKSQEFHDIFGKHDNLEIELIPSNFDKTSKKMRDAIETGDKKQFLKYIPDNLSPDHKEECWNIVHSEINEQIASKSFWKKIISEQIDYVDIFNISTTGMPNYDIMIEDPSYFFFFKDQSISLQWMTPQDYMELCALDVHDTSPSEEYNSVKIPDVQALIKAVQAGVKLDTPVLNVDNKSQEGRHRTIAAAHLGCEMVPVYVVSRVHGGKQKDAVKILIGSENYEEAKGKLMKMGIPLDEKVYNKVKWKDFKLKLK